MEKEQPTRKVTDDEIKYMVLGWYIYEILLKKNPCHK
jgi:hypothetical protein